jgi:hypothetical protein
MLSKDAGRIKIEIGLREDLLEASIQADAATLTLNPFTRRRGPRTEPAIHPCLGYPVGSGG